MLIILEHSFKMLGFGLIIFILKKTTRFSYLSDLSEGQGEDLEKKTILWSFSDRHIPIWPLSPLEAKQEVANSINYMWNDWRNISELRECQLGNLEKTLSLILHQKWNIFYVLKRRNVLWWNNRNNWWMYFNMLLNVYSLWLSIKVILLEWQGISYTM